MWEENRTKDISDQFYFSLPLTTGFTSLFFSKFIMLSSMQEQLLS